MLQERVQKDLMQAMREKNTLAKGVLTLVKSGLDSLEKEKKMSLNEFEALSIIQREIKQTKQALEAAEKAGRDDLIEKETQKIKLLESYLPAQMSVPDATSLLIQNGIKKGMNMGEAMKIAKPLLNGKLDNSKISMIVKDLTVIR